MTMLANVKENKVMTLADYEARIYLYKEQIGTGYIGIGRTLIEAKEAKVVPHGQWETWVTETTGLTARQAQRCMQAATEIKDGSAMARLEMSKALLLLSSGLDEETREEIATQAADEGATVKDLREQLKQAKLKLVQETGAGAEIREALKTLETERQQLENQLHAREEAYKTRIDEAREDAYKRGEKAAAMDAQHEIFQLRKDLESNRQQRQSLQDQLKNAREAADLQMRGIRNELNKQTQYAESLKKALDEKDEQHQLDLAECDREAREEERAKMAAAVPGDYAKDREILLAAAEEAEKRAADAEAELEALKAAGAGQPDPVWKVLKVAMTRFMADCEMMPLDPAAMAADRQLIEANLTRLERWADMMRIALAGVVPAEGAVE